MHQIISSSDYLAHVVATSETNPYIRRDAKTFRGVYLETAKLELRRRGMESEPFDYSQLAPELDRIRNREDMAEFGIPAAKPGLYHANGHANVWVTELGSKAQNKSFESFESGFMGVGIERDTFDFTYCSPSQGEMCFGWDQPLRVKGKEIAINDYPRYDNPYCQAEFFVDDLKIRFDGSEWESV